MSGGAPVLELDGASLGLADLARVARDPAARVAIAPEAMARVAAGRRQIEAIVDAYRDDHRAYRAGELLRRPVQDYGVTTGYGEFKDIPIPPDMLEETQRNLLLSHAAGVGDSADPDDPASYFAAEVVRAALVIRLNAFLRGCSGVRPVLVEAVRDLLHAGIVPLVPTRGSLGSSGDLCPLAHLFAVFLGEGRYYKVRGRDDLGRAPTPSALVPASDLARDLGAPPPVPGVKEGLALTNGATFSTALLALAVHDAQALAGVADVAVAMSLEAACGCARAYDPKVHAARPHPGQAASAARVRALLAGSRLIEAAGAVQDPYSLRCAPAVHGASRDALAYAAQVAERELNAATDNPLFFPAAEEPPWDLAFRDNWPPGYDGDVRSSYSAGNFHGQPVALAADVATIAVAELGAIAERRVQLLLDRHHNRGLPANLVARRGVNSGYMLAQYSAASLVCENRVLAHPAAVDSIPTAANVEDHVANATVAGRKLRTVVANVEATLAVELLVAAQAIDWRYALGGVAAADGSASAGLRSAWERAEAEAEAFASAVGDEHREAIAGRLGAGTGAAYRAVRAVVPPLLDDRATAEDLRRARLLIADGTLLGAVAAALGELR